jgi:hypothetical protein
MTFPAGYHAELVTPTQYGNVLAGSAAGNQLSPNGSYAGGTSRAAFIGYLVAALAAVLLIAQAITGSWRLALASFLALPGCLSGAVLVTFATGQQQTLAAAAGLLGVFALAVRLVIGVAARLRAGAAVDGPGERIDLGSPAATAIPVLVTAVTLVPFIVMGDVPGMELLHTAAAVILGGLAATLLVCLIALPVAGHRFGLAATAEPGEALTGPAMTSGADAAGGVTVRDTRPPAEAVPGQTDGATGSGVEPATVRDDTEAYRDGLWTGPPTGAWPPPDTQRPDADGFRDGA